MSRSLRRFFLGLIATLCATTFVFVLAEPSALSDAKRPEDFEGRVAWLARHPPDWRVTSGILDNALDSSLPQRVELWRAAHAHARTIAPWRMAPQVSFVRGGLFHWNELGPADRKAVLEAATPLMKDPSFFANMHGALWQLTRDFAWLRRVAPDTTSARQALYALAITTGEFDESRTLREELRRDAMRTFAATRTSAAPGALLDLLPHRITTEDTPLVQGILDDLGRQTVDPERMNPRIEDVVRFAIRHDVRPLTGVVPMLERPGPLQRVTRARAALALGDVTTASRIELTSPEGGTAEWTPYYLDRARFEARRGEAAAADSWLARAAAFELNTRVLAAAHEVATILGQERAAQQYRQQLAVRARLPRAWSGTCGTNELCATTTATVYVASDPLRLDLAPIQSDELPPYIEIYLDDTRIAEGALEGPRSFVLPAAAGLHQLEVRLLNPRTRNGIQRRVRLS